MNHVKKQIGGVEVQRMGRIKKMLRIIFGRSMFAVISLMIQILVIAAHTAF